MSLVWNEEDESSSLLKSISIAVETDIEIDDEINEGNAQKNSSEEQKGAKEEPNVEVTAGKYVNTLLMLNIYQKFI